MSKQLWRVLLITLVLTLGLADCAQPVAPAAPAGGNVPANTSAPAAASQEKVFKLGIDGPFTGPSARTGQEFQDAVKFAFDKINWKIGDYKIEPVWVDDQSDPAKATLAIEGAIVKDKIQALTLNWNSSVSVAGMDVVAKYKIPWFMALGASSVINDKYDSDPQKYSYFIGKGWASPATYVSEYADALHTGIDNGTWDPGEKRGVFCNVDNDWGRSFGDALKASLVAKGWTVVSDDYYQDGATDFSALVGKWKGLKPNLVVVSDSTVSGAAAAKQIREGGLPVMLICDNLSRGAAEWYDIAGKASDYCLDMTGTFSKPQSKEFVEAFKAKYGYEPAFEGGLVYDVINYFIKVAEGTIAQYGELTSETFYKFSMEQVVTGKLTYKDGVIMPEYQFTKETMPDPVVAPDKFTMSVIQLMGGKGKVIWPPAFKEADLAVPPELQKK